MLSIQADSLRGIGIYLQGEKDCVDGLISTSEREPGATTNNDLDDCTGQSATVVNNRARCFTLHYNHRKRYP